MDTKRPYYVLYGVGLRGCERPPSPRVPRVPSTRNKTFGTKDDYLTPGDEIKSKSKVSIPLTPDLSSLPNGFQWAVEVLSQSRPSVKDDRQTLDPPVAHEFSTPTPGHHIRGRERLDERRGETVRNRLGSGRRGGETSIPTVPKVSPNPCPTPKVLQVFIPARPLSVLNTEKRGWDADR